MKEINSLGGEEGFENDWIGRYAMEVFMNISQEQR